MITLASFPSLWRTVSTACMVLLLTCGGVGAAEVPLVDGTHWTRSSDEVKKAYLIGLANLVQVEAAYYADNPALNESGFSPRVARGMKGQTLVGVLEALDKWYADHPEQLQRPVVETIWFEMVVPALRQSK